jgi:hypothetical protein
VKKYYINRTEVTKEVMILNMVKQIAATEDNNSVELRNEIYKEVSKLVNEHSLAPDNHTFNLDMVNSFHIIEHKKEGVELNVFPENIKKGS